MIKDNQRVLNRFHIIMDGFLIALAFYIAYILRFESFLTNTRFFRPDYIGPKPEFLESYIWALYFIVPGYLLIYSFCNLYSPKRSNGKYYTLWALIKANFIGIAFFTFALYLLKEINVSRKFIALFFVTNVAMDALFRYLITRFLRFFRKKGYNLKHIILVGYSRAAERYINRIKANPQWGYYIHGILDNDKKTGATYKGIEVIGSIDKLSELLAENNMDEIAITLSIKEYSQLEYIVGICEKSGVHTKFIPDYHNVISTRPYTEDLDGLPVINIRNVPLSNTLNKVIKRGIDIFGSLFAILLFSLPMIITSIIIKTTSRGPLIFSQVRVGLHNEEFKMYKFRSMRQQTEEAEKKAWTTLNDPRVTRIGRFIRKTSIDELPQLFNVLKGEMSMIGPRPERPFFVEKFKEEIPRYMIKHQVRPGLTGWAQVNGLRGDTSIKSRIEHDLYYIENWTLGLDFKILLMTFFKGFVNKNAY